MVNPNLCASPQAISLVLRLSHRASRVFKAFSDDEVVKVLSALTILGQHDEELLAAMEKHLPGETCSPPAACCDNPPALSCLLLLLPVCFCCLMVFPVCSLRRCGSGFSGRLEKCDTELISTVMEYCLQTRCRSKPIFEAVAEDFVRRGEKHTTLQIAKQVIAMGRLNYLPQVSEMSLDNQLRVTNQVCSRKKRGFMSGLWRLSVLSVLRPHVQEAGEHFVDQVLPVSASLPHRGVARLHPPGTFPTQPSVQSLQSILPAEAAG